ncbi:PAS domain S-box protein [Anaerobacillus sp. MEB173]|uniref:PAS domain S-box protein n=1 Tax=Anaerobacillus sp. MEB173 TaxID=3383345 RepID=UPI003F91B9BA
MNKIEKVNILIVDDRQENLLALEAVLDSSNYNLIFATSGEEALKYVLMYNFAVILLDVQMPGLNGFDTARLIKNRKNSKHIPIIFITAISQASEHVHKGYSVGAVDYIFKPFDPQALKSKVEAFVKMYLYHEQIKVQSEMLKQHAIELEHTNEKLKRTTSMLRKSESLARVVGKTSIDTILTINETGHILSVNEAIEHMFGYDKADVVGLHIDEVILRTADNKQIGEAILSNMKGKIIEVLAIRKDKSTFPADIQIGEDSVEDQQIFVCFIRDITERKIMENQLKQHNITLEKRIKEQTKELVLTNKDLQLSEERFRKIFECSPNLIAIRSLKDDRYIDVNESWLDYTGYQSDEVINCTKNLLQFESSHNGIGNSDLQESVRNKRISYLNKAGEYREGLLSTEAVNIHGEACIISVITDITERVQWEKEMGRLDRLNLIGEMAAGIAHEIRNPMTTVLGFLQISKNQQQQSLPDEYINLMIDELNRANSIITEFLTLAKNKVADRQLQDVNKIIEAVFPLLQAEALLFDKSIELKLSNCPLLSLDEKEIRQLILNLVLNGLEAMDSEGVLTIKTYTDSESSEVVLEIQDQGSGIDKHILDKLGTPFFTTKEKGTGLGLAVCYSVASRHNASIDIETSDRGTIFFVRFKQNLKQVTV